MKQGSAVTIRVTGCSSARPCYAPKRLLVALAPAGTRAIPKGRLPIVGRINAFGLLHGRMPAVAPGTYALVSEAQTVTLRGTSYHWRRVFVSNPFTVSQT
jgi:hypothetical protein